jgi:hypothetical protein
MDYIKKEGHKLTLFHIYPKPDSFIPENKYGTKVHFDKNIIEGDPFTFVVKVETSQQVGETQCLCVCNSLSEYEVSISKDELTLNYDNWYGLVQRSIVECNKLYKEKVKGTYLDGTDIPLP